MKSLAVVVLIALAALGVVAGASAQSGNSPAATQAPASTPAPSDSSSASGAVSTPSGDMKGQVTIDRKSESTTTDTRTDSGKSDDGASALPRTVVSERTTIFGLSPTAAVVIAAALLVVVILAIVAMTRSNDTYVER